jgi:hypothetical protein
MKSGKQYHQAAKRRAARLWIVLSTCVAAAMIVPYYWFWTKISASVPTLILISGALLWTMWTWGKLAAAVANRIGKLAEAERPKA